MKLLTALAGGFAGACALTLLHQAIKKADRSAPHVDELGMEALSTSLEKAGVEPPQGEKLYNWTLTGDIIANTMYYSLASIGSRKNIGTRASFLGLLGGIGAVYLPEPLHLTQSFTNRTPRTKFLTVGLYTFGGIVAGSVMKVLSFNTIKAEKKVKKLGKGVKKETDMIATNVKEGAHKLVTDVKEGAHIVAADVKRGAKKLRKSAGNLKAQVLS